MDTIERIELLREFLKNIHDSLEDFERSTSNRKQTTTQILDAISNFYGDTLPELISESYDALVTLESIEEGVKLWESFQKETR